ncbi:MAG: HDOD domain-containing protein [Gammaproteobacteria bacterium]|nr:HDOD domain-containing protein [Gammaproteobacteria bacterium]
MGNNATNLLEEMGLTKLPSLPHVLIKLLDACHDENACFDKLTAIIAKDAVLSAKLISVANSPVYGKVGKLTTHKQILLFLGLDTIKSIAITASVQQFFSHYSREKTHFLKNFWKHTLYTAIVAKSLAKLTAYENPEEAYLAGLLHDIGQMVFESLSKNEYSQLVRNSVSAQQLHQSEFEKYHITHDQVGAQLLSLWSVPEVITEAVKYHHASSQEIREAHHLVKIINLANRLTTIGNTETADYDQQLFDLTDSVLEDVVSKADIEVNKLASSLQIDIDDSDAIAEHDEKKHIQLAAAIRDISLTQAAVQPLPSTADGIDFSAIQKSMMMLFGLNKSCLFLYDKESSCLLPQQTSIRFNKAILEAIRISDNSDSLLAVSLKNGDIMSSFAQVNESLQPVVDQQIIKALDAEGMMCVPLLQAGQYAGMIVAGCGQQQYQKLMERSALLTIYAAEVAAVVCAALSKREEKKEFIAETQEMIRARSREIIHEVNNPLAVIKNYLHVLGKRFSENDQVQLDLRIIAEEIDRVGSVVLKCDKSLDGLTDPDQLQQINVNDVINTMHSIMMSSLYVTHGITANKELESNLCLISANKNSIKQILTNLIKNSVEAMDNEKQLSVATRNINISGKRFVEIEIQDTGPGLPDMVLNNLYKPVKSTKGQQHSGLGLSIVKSLIDDMGGDITCRTNSSGTMFSIHFPISEAVKP